MEIFAALKGKDRQYVDEVLGQYGPKKFCSSQQAIGNIIADLRAYNPNDTNTWTNVVYMLPTLIRHIGDCDVLKYEEHE